MTGDIDLALGFVGFVLTVTGCGLAVAGLTAVAYRLTHKDSAQ